MTKQLLIAGAGIGGLAAALACARAGWQPRIYDQAAELSEIGAGIQLGPNVTRILRAWGLEPALSRVAAFPKTLNVCSAINGSSLGRMPLGEAMAARYGAPYVTVHRADLQRILLDATGEAGIELNLSARIANVMPMADAVRVRLDGRDDVEGDALVGADGLWSVVRSQVFADGLPTATGHVAYRSLVAQSRLPASLRTEDVLVWLGPRMHCVAYPARGGDQLNVVAIVEDAAHGSAQDWDQGAVVSELLAAAGTLCSPLRALVEAMPAWRRWTLHDRPPLRDADQMAKGCVALLGDAAHPMRPYLAQGAGMAIEDSAELARVLAMASDAALEVPLALRRYALNRWERCARVQARSRRNGAIFHASGPIAWGRDLSMKLLGERLLDQPWLYRG